METSHRIPAYRQGYAKAFLAVLLLLMSCRGVTNRNLGYDGFTAPFAGDTVDIMLMGTYTTSETPSGTVDLTGSPYRLIIMVSGEHAAQRRLIDVALTGADGTKLHLSGFTMSPPTEFAPSISYVARGVQLPYVDYTGSVRFQYASRGTVTDSVPFTLRRQYQERKLSFWEIVGGL